MRLAEIFRDAVLSEEVSSPSIKTHFEKMSVDKNIRRQICDELTAIIRKNGFPASQQFIISFSKDIAGEIPICFVLEVSEIETNPKGGHIITFTYELNAKSVGEISKVLRANEETDDYTQLAEDLSFSRLVVSAKISSDIDNATGNLI